MKKNHLIALISLIIIGLAGLFVWKNASTTDPKNSKLSNPPSQTSTENLKTISAITFGDWQPTETRTILGTVESPSDIQIVAKNSGTIEQVLVNTGQKVNKGQLLATYKTSNDLSQIQYTNALSTLQTTKISGESAIQNAQIALQNAENDYAQALRTADRTIDQSFITLTANRESAETVVKTVRDYVDRAFGVSARYQSQRDTDFEPVGRNNSLLRQQTRTLVDQLVNNYRAYENKNWLEDFDYYRLTEQERAVYRADQVAVFLDQSKLIMDNMVDLIRSSNTSSSFTAASRDSLQAEAESLLSRVNSAVITLDTQTESTRTTATGQDSAILSAKNRVEAAKTQLRLAEANADSQINSAQSQLRLAQKSQQDLEIFAPFSGTITERMINNFDRVNSGEPVFSIVSDGSLPEIVAQVTPEEWELLANRSNPLQVRINGGDMILVDDLTMNGKLSALSQKFSIKLLPSVSDIENKKIFIGSFAEIQLPLTSEQNNLIPISAVSFEPGGAEVLILEEMEGLKDENEAVRNTETELAPPLNEEEDSKQVPLTKGDLGGSQKASRQPIQTGRIIGNAIEVLEGLETNDRIVEFRQQVKSGEDVKIK